jgi:MFS family permease
MVKRTFFKDGELKLLWPFYFEAAILSIFYIFIPFQVIYLLNLGFSLFQIGLLTSAQLLAAFLFEIPTGAVADIFGKKASTLIGHFVVGCSLMGVFFFTNFYILFALFFIWGFGQTFVSGAYESWVIDKLEREKKKKLVQEYYSKTSSFYSFALLISGLIGAFFVKQYGLSIIWLISGLDMILIGILLVFISENYKRRKKANLKEHYKDFKKQIISSFKYAFTHHNLRLMLIAMAFLAIFGLIVRDLTWTPLLQSVGFKEHWFGYLFSATLIFGIFIPHFVKGLVKKSKGYRNYLIIILAMMFLLLVALAPLNGLIPFLIIYVLLDIMWMLFLPGMRPFFQSFIPSRMRATITSLDSQIFSLAGIVAMPLVGLIADNIGPKYTIIGAVIFLIPIIYLYSKLKEK